MRIAWSFVLVLAACGSAEDASSSSGEGGHGGGAPTYPACASDADCLEHEVCLADLCRVETSGGCGSGCCCPDGEACDAAGECRAECNDHHDCYALTAFCAADGFCYGAVAGAPSNDCERALLAPPIQSGGPLLYDGDQHDRDPGPKVCAKDPANCTNNGNVCAFTFGIFDPDGDLPATDVGWYQAVGWIDARGERQPTFEPVLHDPPGSFTFSLCFDEALGRVGGAVQVVDEGGRSSNAHCFEGAAP